MSNNITRHTVIRDNDISSDDEPPELVSTPAVDSKYTPHYLSSPGGRQADSILPGLQSLDFLNKYFPGAGMSDWCDWKWQIRNSIRTLRRLKDFIDFDPGELFPGLKTRNNLPLRISPYYLSLIDKSDPYHAIGKTVIPVIDEYITSKGELSDPLCEHECSPVPNLVHRYPDRVLLLVTDTCSTYCRFCTRSRFVSKGSGSGFNSKSLEQACLYIQNHKEIRDVVVSGGDPLTLGDNNIERILFRLRSISHVEIIRIGTKVPVTLPQRITTSLTDIIRKYHPVWMSIHFTHPAELTPESKQACERLADAGIPLGSQTVLLKGVNDRLDVLRELFLGLLKIRVRPYYLYQCDPVPGTSHFRTPVSRGIEMIQGLRGHISGYAVPHFVIDAPGGGGKIPLLPEYYLGTNDNGVLLKNFEGKTFIYPDDNRTLF